MVAEKDVSFISVVRLFDPYHGQTTWTAAPQGLSFFLAAEP